jgi:mannose-6-phosphate isomerase-like protein (cupin superfamily)
MTKYETAWAAQVEQQRAPDGSSVRPLLSLGSGSMAQFQLDPGQVSRAVRHRSVGEIWLVVSGRGQMWRQQHEQHSVVDLEPGVCVSIPAGTAFQFRCTGGEAMRIAAVTMPPWPGDEEAEFVPGKW